MAKLQSQIQIYNSIIRCPKLSSLGFVLYAQLTYLYRGKEVVIRKEKLMEYLFIKDKRTFKKALDELFDLNLVKEKYIELPKFKPLILTPLNCVEKNAINFTQLPTRLLIDKLKIINYEGFRLMYYYESLINRKSNIIYANPSLKRIYHETGIYRNGCIKYNKILEKYKLLYIHKHDIGIFYTDNGIEYNRFNNNYYILIDNF